MAEQQWPTQGPASYFPSIEKRYGESIEHWLDLLRGLGDAAHMEKVAYLKNEHGLGHGHANTLVAWLKQHPEG